MKKVTYFLLLSLTSGCSSTVDLPTAFNVAGVYQLIWYSSATVSDDNPSGTMQATQIDNDHINLVVKGQSGKVKINYTYTNVLVSETNSGKSGQVNYSMTYKKQLIGSARVDGVSRYVILTPTSKLRLEGLDL